MFSLLAVTRVSPVRASSLVIFVLGAWATAVAAGSVYTWIFADQAKMFLSRSLIWGFLMTLLVGGLIGGLGAVIGAGTVMKKRDGPP